MDNVGAVTWPAKGKSVFGLARAVLSSFIYYCIYYGVEPVGLMDRTYNNISADLWAICTREDERAWAERNSVAKVGPTPWWEFQAGDQLVYG